MERTLSAVLIWTLWTENCWSQQVTHSSVMHGLSGSTHRWFPLRICSRNATLIFVSFSWDPFFFFFCQFVISPRKVSVWQDGWPWTHLDLWQLLLQNAVFPGLLMFKHCASLVYEMFTVPWGCRGKPSTPIFLTPGLGFNYVICSCVSDYCSRDAAVMLT